MKRALTLAAVIVFGTPSLGSAAEPSHPYDAFVVEAALRFGIPEAWIRAIIGVESANNTRAVSPKGAIGLMQLMPGTWSYLRNAYGLGPDPFDPRDNILAGTAYLRELCERYGTDGFLAAYNAGPGRYEDNLTSARPLPNETIAYVSNLRSQITLAGPVANGCPSLKPEPSWTNSDLFERGVLGADEHTPSPFESLNSPFADRRIVTRTDNSPE